MKVRDLLAVFAECDPDDEVHVAVDLSEPNSSVSFHEIREAHGCYGSGAVELVVYEAHDLFDSPPWLAAALLGQPELQ